MDSFLQSLVLAPLFVWFEVLFTFDYRKGLRRAIDKRIKVLHAAMKKKENAAKTAH